MRVGFLGGTFDPPHNGHLLIARAARDQLQLDGVLFAPAGVQPLKQDQHVSDPEQRAAMVALMIAGEERLALSRIDLDRAGPHYTVDLLNIAQREFPDAHLWFIMGGDSLRDLLKWRQPGRIIELARLAVVRRPGFEPDWPALELALPDVRLKIDWIDLSPITISASELQRRTRAGESIEGLVPDAVAQYIAEHDLYR